MVGGLDNRILFSMEATAEFVSLSRTDSLFLAETTDVQAVFQSGRSSIVTRGQNLFIFDQDRSYLPSQTGRSLGNQMSDIHEILFPGGSMGSNLLFLFLFQG
jgi:hypothetical protein